MARQLYLRQWHLYFRLYRKVLTWTAHCRRVLSCVIRFKKIFDFLLSELVNWWIELSFEHTHTHTTLSHHGTLPAWVAFESQFIPFILPSFRLSSPSCDCHAVRVHLVFLPPIFQSRYPSHCRMTHILLLWGINFTIVSWRDRRRLFTGDLLSFCRGRVGVGLSVSWSISRRILFKSVSYYLLLDLLVFALKIIRYYQTIFVL